VRRNTERYFNNGNCCDLKKQEKIMEKHNVLKITVGSAFGLGLSPIIPGTMGSLLGIIIYMFSAYIFPTHVSHIFLILIFLFISWLNHILTPWAVSYYKNEDPQHFVLDEVAGFLVLPIAFYGADPLYIITYGFIIFRILDAIKIPPANYIDTHLHGPFGILLDDVVSALYTVAILNTLLLFFNINELLFFA